MKKIHESELTHKIAAIVCGLCLVFILLTSAVQAVCFWIPDWWRNEYAKYDTPSQVTGEMSLDDAVHVTEDMLDYCIGRLGSLDYTYALIDGVNTAFFTDREKAHLADCRELFMAGMRGRAIAILLFAGLFFYLYIHSAGPASEYEPEDGLSRRKAGDIRGAMAMISAGYLKALAFTAALGAVFAILAVRDFDSVFVKFHHIFFDNDLWLLDPSEDNLVNIMQEEVFADAALWIGSIFFASALILGCLALIILSQNKKAA